MNKKEEATTGNEQNKRYIGPLPGGTPHQSLVNHLLASLPRLSNAINVIRDISFLGYHRSRTKSSFFPFHEGHIKFIPIQFKQQKIKRGDGGGNCTGALLVQTLVQACH